MGFCQGFRPSQQGILANSRASETNDDRGMVRRMSEKPTIFTYPPLVSKDRTLLVQVFIDPETNLIVQASVATRQDSWGTWGLPTEVFED